MTITSGFDVVVSEPNLYAGTLQGETQSNMVAQLENVMKTKVRRIQGRSGTFL